MGCVSSSLVSLRRVNRSAPARFFGVGARHRPKTRAAWSAWSTAEDGPGREFVRAMIAAERRGSAVACLNEQLAEVDSDLGRAQGSRPGPRSPAARISLGGGAFFAALDVARGLPDPGFGPVSAVLAMSLGVVSACTVWQIDRLADARARRVRAEWDDWAKALERLLPSE
jgi:hypothetical protein